MDEQEEKRLRFMQSLDEADGEIEDIFNARLIQIALPLDHPYWKKCGLRIVKNPVTWNSLLPGLKPSGWVVEYRDFSTQKQEYLVKMRKQLESSSHHFGMETRRSI